MDPSDGTDGDSKLAATAAGSNANADRRARVYAAAELFKTFGEPGFKAYVDRWAPDIAATAENGMHPFKDWKQVDPLNYLALTQGLFVYSTTDGANPVVTEPFREALAHSAEAIRQATGGPDDPYLAYHYEGHYCWGSNSAKGRWGRVLLMTMALGIIASTTRPIARSCGISPFHSRTQPLSLCYLTNMTAAGADTA